MKSMAKILKIQLWLSCTGFVTIISLLVNARLVTSNNDTFTTKYIYTTRAQTTESTSTSLTRTTVSTRLTSPTLPQSQVSDFSCRSVTKWWNNKGFDKKQLPSSSLKNDSHLRTCIRGLGTCCTQAMEHKLEMLSRHELNATIFKSHMEELRNTFMDKAIALHNTSMAIINRSAISSHDLFLNTYGIYYSENSDMFANLYNTLRLFLKGDKINLMKVFERFFSELVKKLFTLSNASYRFDEKYLECADKHITGVQNLSQNTYSIFNLIKRSIVTTKTFIQALNVGKDMLHILLQLDTPLPCTDLYARMSTCSYCAGMSNVRPCTNYCLNVVSTCYAPYYVMDGHWMTYIDQLDIVVRRLESSFMFLSAIDQLGIKLSEYIMEFQARMENIKNDVFNKCGEPSSGVRMNSKREASPDKKKSKYKNSNNPINRNDNNNKHDHRHNSNIILNRNDDPQMSQIMYHIKSDILSSKNIFSEFTAKFCRNESDQHTNNKKQQKQSQHQQQHQQTAQQDDVSCWNGTSRITTYDEERIPVKQLNHSKQYTPVIHQMKKLQDVTYWLSMAVNDKDVPWEEESDSDDDDDGSGLGEDDEDEEERDDDDDDDYNGSGDYDDDDVPDEDESSGFGDDDEDVPPASRKHYATNTNNNIPQHNHINLNNNNHFPYNKINDITTRKNIYQATNVYSRSHAKPYYETSTASTTTTLASTMLIIFTTMLTTFLLHFHSGHTQF